MLFLYSIGIPFAVILIALIVFRATTHKFYVSLLGLAISLVLTASLTNLAKNAIGRPRPDFLDRCKARPGTPQSSLVGMDVCTQTNDHTLQDGWRSFPSGHSSFAFSGLGYLALGVPANCTLSARTRTFYVACSVSCLWLQPLALRYRGSRTTDMTHTTFLLVVCSASLWLTHRTGGIFPH